MEELQSTEVLDREILEDARKKAYRILKNAEESAKAGRDRWEKKSDAAVAELRDQYARKLRTAQGEFAARLIVDKRRVRSEKIEGLLKTTMEAYLLNLARETLLSILERMLGQRLDVLRKTGELVEEGLEIEAQGLQEQELKELLNRRLPQGSWTLRSSVPAALQDGQFPAVIIHTPAARIVGSINALMTDLMQDKRAELITALAGEAALTGGEV